MQEKKRNITLALNDTLAQTLQGTENYIEYLVAKLKCYGKAMDIRFTFLGSSSINFSIQNPFSSYIIPMVVVV